jgi:5-methylcytosine-specific restriction endonuclease McrA
VLKSKAKARRLRNPEAHRNRKRLYESVRQALKRGARKHPSHSRFEERAILEEAAKLSVVTGEKHHVDHIIPISSGGWHHHLNLQVLPARLNTSKASNPIWELDGYKCWRDVPKWLWPDEMAHKYEALSSAKPGS